MSDSPPDLPAPPRSQRAVAADVRARFVEALQAAGPGAPTLCAGWTARDLAAHAVAREHRPDADLGLVVPRLAARAEAARKQALRRPFADLLAALREGPPLWSPFAVPFLGAVANLVEYAVHTEDVRRGGATLPQAAPVAGLDAALTRQLRGFGRLRARGLPVGIEARTPSGAVLVPATRSSGPVVVLTGEPLEVLLYLTGRTSAARVRLDGDPDAVAALGSAPLGM